MSFLRYPFFVLVAAGCVPAAAPTAGADTAEMADQEPAGEVAPTPAPTPAPAPARKGFRIIEPTLADRPNAVTLSLIARGGLGASFSADGESVLVVRGRGGLVMSADGKRKPRALPRRHFVASRFSPDGAHVVLQDERKRLTIVDATTGKQVATVDKAERPRWIDRDTLLFRRGCSQFRMVIGGPASPIGTAPRPCGDLVQSSADGTTIWLASRGRYRRGVLTTYKRLVAFDLVARRSRLLVDGTDDAHFMLPKVSADGDRVCYVDALFDLFCRTRNGAPHRIWRNVRRPVRLHDSGRWLLFAVGKHTSPDSVVGVVNFDRETITLVPRAGRQWWSFLGDGTRIAGDGGSSSALVYDLKENWKSAVGEAGAEWEGLFPAPDRRDRFVVGRERGGTRDLFLATIR